MIYSLEDHLETCPLIAILRGIKNDECIAIGEALYSCGVRIMEVPLNSPNPIESIRLLSENFKGRAIVGAGTVTCPDDVARVKAVGGQVIIAPNFDEHVGRMAKQLGLIWMPGVFTPTEAFAALRCKADILKIFPADLVSPILIKAWLATLPQGTRLAPVGGITANNIKDYLEVGAKGFGVGGSIYTPGDTPEAVRAKVDSILSAL
ncbi:2-dehydro-3-deoxy-6-phosphogalactonate aldolase [Photobacterium sp. ZSDE20]|uniref:2-dehydro-3-deoxy-6-phosphogalactonate aldolase n=1 Tax=Photobacterium pectinilyticum TaxID=2906793 RepID=A0ABT1N631_9GAMM|nr:2-dehydro-3-deoxy-6-phosphogalactonate aldolase [Photobacterium sp. ZSDE20]MCQ1060195.1 2-dehydro-3-deoxy-6-phosphogalactonate aldolase [Photobacterium sp. ZSDE20]MDD1827644.1 2-dehydro-3-deoxy-6-phosphogalactonate aldolase [Photobacterium sp. ZSDE20]